MSKNSSYAIFAVALLGAGAVGLLIFSMAPPPGAPPSVGEGAPDRESRRGAQEFVTRRVDEEASKGSERITSLELDSTGLSASQASAESAPDAAEAARASSPSGILQPGRGDVLFLVEDSSGQPLRDVSVILAQLDADGGEAHAATTGRGEVSFSDLAPGPYSYRARTNHHPPLVSVASFRLDEGERKRITVRLGGSKFVIRGRVLNSLGEPIPEIEISAVRHRFASALGEDESGAVSIRRTVSREDGSFSIEVLADGEYEVRTTATGRYGSLKVTLQAGGSPADLILVEGFAVAGRVTNIDAEPLARVWVGLRENRNIFTYTDDNGRYRLQLGSGFENLGSTIRFYLAGYEERLLGLAEAQPRGARELGLDTELRPVENAASVVGSVLTERGSPIAGATVLFGSPELRTHYQTVSDADGSFSISNVEVGPGYQLRILPSGSFLDYSRERIRVPEDGVSLEAFLEALPTGRLTGRMLDADGNPLPDFRLWLLNRDASKNAVPITSDAHGYFNLTDAPAGSLVFDNRASPRHIVNGVFLPDDGEREVTLVLDSGELTMTGAVVDDRGDPVGGADVSLAWSNGAGEIQSSSRRVTRTDSNGSFRFTELGPGEHLLEVRAANYRTVQEYHEVGRFAADVEVRLEPEGP